MTARLPGHGAVLMHVATPPHSAPSLALPPELALSLCVEGHMPSFSLRTDPGVSGSGVMPHSLLLPQPQRPVAAELGVS